MCADIAVVIAITGYLLAEQDRFSDMNLKPFANFKALANA